MDNLSEIAAPTQGMFAVVKGYSTDRGIAVGDVCDTVYIDTDNEADKNALMGYWQCCELYDLVQFNNSSKNIRLYYGSAGGPEFSGGDVVLMNYEDREWLVESMNMGGAAVTSIESSGAFPGIISRLFRIKEFQPDELFYFNGSDWIKQTGFIGG